MIRPPPRSTRTHSFPTTTLFRSNLGTHEAIEEGRADPGDDGEHQHLDARGDDVAKDALGHEGGAAEKGEGNEHEARERNELELEDRHEDLHREDEEGEDDDHPGDQQNHDRSEEHTSELQSLMRNSY